MKKSRCKDKVYFSHQQEFSELFVINMCYITYFYPLSLFYDRKWMIFIPVNNIQVLFFFESSFNQNPIAFNPKPVFSSSPNIKFMF